MVQRERIWELERAGKILVLAPPTPVTVTSSEHDGEPLLSLYIQGRREAEEHVDQIATFLK
jgi:predicted patatin/cPLA2 family phospholipase